MEVLRGRDGRDGRDSEKGEVGSPGTQGEMGVAGPRGAVGTHGDAGLQGEPGLQGPLAGGAVYTRWGCTTCPTNQGTTLEELQGHVGTTKGGTANYLCLPNDKDSTRVECKDVVLLVE